MNPKAQLWVIASDEGGWFADDRGGDLFTSERLAQAAVERHKLTGCKVVPCGLDDDLAQMCDLYRESNNRTEVKP